MTEGVDYFVRFVEFPNRANDGCTIVNDDGTYDIYLNTLYPMAHLEQKLEHELQHLKREHFYVEHLSIEDIEAEADGQRPNPFAIPGFIPEFTLESLSHYVRSVCGGVVS